VRIIAGKAKSLPLKSVPGNGTRPTTDRIKETLFNMLQPYIYDSRFADIFSGSGSIGLEALSRGARECVLIEQDKKAAAVIAQNIAFTKLGEHARLMQMDFLSALKQLEGREPFDLIFADPPYNQQLELRLLEYLSSSTLIHEDTLVIVEASLETDFSYLPKLSFELVKEKTYKTNKHILIQKMS
jgi:16S rRNA (guanine966-N2)-methyltransferase